MKVKQINKLILVLISIAMFFTVNITVYALPFNLSFSSLFNNKPNEHLNEIVIFDDETGIGKYFDLEINGRTFRFKTVLLKERSYEQSDASYLLLESDRDFIDVGILSSGYYTVVVFSKRVGIMEDERVKIQGKAAHGITSFSTENIIKTAEKLACGAIKNRKYIEITKFDKVNGRSQVEYYKESPYVMYEKLDSEVYHRISVEKILEEFGAEVETTNGLKIYEYEGQKYSIDDKGVIVFAFDKPKNIKAIIDKKDKDATDYYDIAVAYEEGNGVRANYNLAIASFEKAAELGSSDAFYRLGRMYDFGVGVNKDYKISKEYYEKAIAIDDNDKALYNLGVLYANGFGVEVDLKKARELYERAAKKNNMYALHNLAMLYNNGEGVEQDYNLAAKYFRLAGEAGNAYSWSCLGIIYELGYTGEYNYEYARECYEKGMEMGSSDAYCNLGLMYLSGSYNNVPNIELGREYLEKAAIMGNTRAINLLNSITDERFPSLLNDNK